MVRALETKFLLFWAGRGQDTVLPRSPAPRPPQPVSLASLRQRRCRRQLGRFWPRRLWSPLPSFRHAPPSKQPQPELPLPVRLRRGFRLRAPLPSASSRSAADVPGPPKHHVTPRGERRCRRNASRLQSGTPAGCGRLWPHPGGGREVGHVPWLALGRFRARDRLLGRPRWSAVTGPPWPLVFPVLPFPSDPFRPSTYLGPGPSARERPRNTKTGRRPERRPLPGEDGVTGNPVGLGVGIIAAWFAAGTCCSGNDRVALPSRGHGSLAQRGCDRFRIKS